MVASLRSQIGSIQGGIILLTSWEVLVAVLKAAARLNYAAVRA